VATSFATYNGYIYAGTSNYIDGCELWELVPPPSLSSISIAKASNGGTLQGEGLSGSGFAPGASVVLKMDGQPDVTATNVSVSATSITCDLPLLGCSPGAWDVCIQNADGQSATLTGALDVCQCAPSVSSIDPAKGTNNGKVDADIKGVGLLKGLTVQLVSPQGGTITGTNCQVQSFGECSCSFDLEGHPAGLYDVYVKNLDGQSGTKNGAFLVEAPPAPPVPPTPPKNFFFYFAEGYTGPNFQEYLCLGNPNTTTATANVTYLFSDGTTKNTSYSVPATGRFTVDVNNEVGSSKEVSIQVQSDTANLVAERPMYFNYNGVWTGGSDAVGVTAPNTNWYFAEGNTLPGFDEYVTVLNPTGSTANLTFKYMVEGSGEQDVGGSVGAHSRGTFKTRDQIGSGLNASLHLSSDQNVVAERSMYFNYKGLANNNWTGGHDVVGANSPASSWYLAEGTTRAGFEEWLCLENPGSSDITVNASYQMGSGLGNPITKSYNVPALQRLTVSVNKEIGPEKDASIELTSTGSFIAERPMYFNYQGKWTGGHDVLGANNSATNWFFAEGTTRTNFDEWLCLQNPGNADAHATITYYTKSGQAINKSWPIPANSRITVNVNTDAGANQDISAKVASDNPIIVERPMYFNYNGVWTGGHDVVGFVPTP
jgi:hypothetical protein